MLSWTTGSASRTESDRTSLRAILPLASMANCASASEQIRLASIDFKSPMNCFLLLILLGSCWANRGRAAPSHRATLDSHLDIMCQLLLRRWTVIQNRHWAHHPPPTLTLVRKRHCPIHERQLHSGLFRFHRRIRSVP